MAKTASEFEFDFAVSFAGEDRATAEQFSTLLKAQGFTVFYDSWNKADLWGRNLYQHLAEIYSKKARFCVMFISAAYAQKAWTRHEMQAAQERAFRENEAYILPVRLDGTAIPGIGDTVAYLDLRRESVAEVAAIAIEKITAAKARGGAAGGSTKSVATPAKAATPMLRASSLRIKKQFTDHDRDTFLEEAYEHIAAAFETSLACLQAQHEGIVGKFRRVNANHFTATVYRNGTSVSACGIRMGGMFRVNQILYCTDPNSTSSMNEGVSVVDDGEAMFLKPMGMTTMFSGRGKGKDKMKAQDAAELFWGMLIEPLQR